MFIIQIETTTGPMTIGIEGLQKRDLNGRLEALINTLAQATGPITLASTHAVVREAPDGTAATLSFRYLGSRFLEFEDRRSFLASVNEHLARRVFQCAEDFEVEEDGRITGEFEYFELIGEGVLGSAASTAH